MVAKGDAASRWGNEREGERFLTRRLPREKGEPVSREREQGRRDAEFFN